MKYSTSKETFVFVFVIFVVIGILMHSTKSEAKPLNLSIQIIASAGVYHRLDKTTDWRLLQHGYGSDTPATFEAGVRFTDKNKWSVDVVFSHQSYIDRGAPFNDKTESFIDMVGIKFTYKFKEWNI